MFYAWHHQVSLLHYHPSIIFPKSFSFPWLLLRANHTQEMVGNLTRARGQGGWGWTARKADSVRPCRTSKPCWRRWNFSERRILGKEMIHEDWTEREWDQRSDQLQAVEVRREMVTLQTTWVVSWFFSTTPVSFGDIKHKLCFACILSF